jgi:dipeptide/tripeptide permease
MRAANIITYSLVAAAIVAFATTVYRYARGLRESPRDLWLLFAYKIVEYTAYGAMNPIMVLWLSKDCGLSDVGAGSFIAVWSIVLSIIGMIAGALVDAIGIRKTLTVSVVFLLIARLVMSVLTNKYLVIPLGLVPLAIGFAIVGPVVSVSIKRYTTKEGSSLGFGLFYVLMNVAFAIGGWFLDFVRDKYALRDAAGKVVDENAGTVLFGKHFSTYQLFFVFGVCFTAVSFFIVRTLREGVELTDQGVVIRPPKEHASGLAAMRSAARETVKMIGSVVREKYFWVFIGMLATTVPVRFTFFHFQYTFPKYGIRVLGQGAKIGSIYGVLNPVLIVLLVPLVASFTKKVSSYRMMIVGSIVSSMSCFIAVIPARVFEPLTKTVLGELIFIKWLGMAKDMDALAANPPTSAYWPLICCILVFTIGEAIWSPRLMQFTAEIAPKGKEGTYIALSVLPFFAAKFVVGPMSGMLVNAYTPLDKAGKALPSYPHHQMMWVWIGGMAVITPIFLLVFRKLFSHPNASGGGSEEAEAEAA